MKNQTVAYVQHRNPAGGFRRAMLGCLMAIIFSSRSVMAAVVPPNELVAGKSYGEWFASLWRWFSETPYDSHHPANDYTGASALNGQTGPVLFLVPASTRSAITRHIAIAEDKWLHVLITGSTCSTIDSDPYFGSNEEELRACAARVAIPVAPSLEIDGESVSDLERFDAISPLFDFTYPPVNVASLPGGGAGQAVGHGINVIIEPLPPGTHVIRYRASQPAENFSYDVTYNITVYARTALSIRKIPETAEIEISWPAVRLGADGLVERPWFELQRSPDLRAWEPLGERVRAGSTAPDEILTQRVSAPADLAFYRLLVVSPPRVSKLGNGGAEVFGYADAFEEEYQRLGPISPEEFATRFALATSYRAGLSWDPTTGNYWEAFNADPAVLNEGKDPDQPGYRRFDARLDEAELARFRQHGFVVSERLGSDSFAEAFFKLWHADLPVFISTDALLQAWHRTYDALLEELEETQLFAAVEALLEGLAGQCDAAAAQIPSGNPVLRESLQDADYFLTVARSLLAGRRQSGAFDQAARVAATLADVNAERLKQVPDFMGHCRMVDYSQFRPRGHYTHSERLERYFKCLMWLGRIDVPIAGEFERCPNDRRPASPREIGFAIVLWHLLQSSGQFETWRQIEETIAAFVGPTDSLTFGGLGGLLAGAGIGGLSDVTDVTVIERLRDAVEAGSLGVQNIRSDWFDVTAVKALPRTFTVLGQTFLPDSWAMSQTVFPALEDDKERRLPGSLDVAFAILGNDQIVPELRAQMEGLFVDPARPHALVFRDGYGHQRNLAAVRAAMDRLTPAAWQGSISTDWMRVLRELSAPTADPIFPEAMRTRAWAMKTLNTQLASWTQLRHDTALYAKQSYGLPSCLYPAAYVEPRAEFWRALRLLALRTAQIVGRLRVSGNYPMVQYQPEVTDPRTGEVIIPEMRVTIQFPLSDIRGRQVAHLEQFADTVHRLEMLVGKQLAQECFSPEDGRFIDSLMTDQVSKGGGCLPVWVEYSGWYPALFYRAIHWDDSGFHDKYGAGAFDALVADIHTDLPGGNDPGSVLHQGVGRVNLLLLAVESGGDRLVCAGPVLSHYEFEVIGAPRRITDSEWAGGGEGTMRPLGILHGVFPADAPVAGIEGLEPPPWTRGYLVPHR